MNRKKILIVDDEPEICELISQHLKRKGIDTKKAYDGKKALQIVKKTKPDLIILDVLMPKMDGFELLQYLKSKPSYSQIPVIMLTVKSGPDDLDKGISLGTDFYLPKPFKLENLTQFIEAIIKDRDI